MNKLITMGIVLLLLFGGFLFIPNEIGGGNMPSPEPCGDMIIDGFTFEIRDAGTYDQAGNVTIINGGVLKIVNSTLNFLCTIGNQYNMGVYNGGSLILQNSTIITAATPLALWDPRFEITLEDSTLKMTDHSALAFPGLLSCSNTVVYINDSWITSIWPDARSTSWAIDFPTYLDVIDTQWWGTLDVDVDDGPVLLFTDCDNVTIADSRIDELYEDAGLFGPWPDTANVEPLIVSGGIGSVDDLLYQDLNYYLVLGGLPSQKMTIDEFNTTGLLDSMFEVLSVRVHAVYNTTTDGVGGYNGTDWVQWSVEGGTPANLFQLVMNTPWAEYTSAALSPTPTFTQIADLNITFHNTYEGGEAKNEVYFDCIELIVDYEYNYGTYPTMITLNNSEMSIINTYVSVDWLNFSDDFELHNAIDLRNGANLYLYNVSMETDDNINGIDDFLELLPGADPELYMPYRTEPGSEVYHYKWLKVPVVDSGGGPIADALVNATLNSPNQWFIDKVYSMNDLTFGTPVNDRILGYLNRTSERNIGAWNYTVTDEYGEVLLPLLCEFINSTCYPNGDHVGNYLIDVSYFDGSWHNKNTTADFVPFPNVRPEENLVVLDPIVLGGVAKRSYILEAGSWNLISLPHIQSNTSLQAVLSSIDGKWDIVQYYDITDLNSPWKSYSIYRPDTLNDLDELNHTIGFWLHTMERCVLTSDGSIAGSTNIPLYAGWNLVGYPTLTEGKTVSEALFGTGADRVEICDPLAPYRIGEVGASYVMKPGEGYWVHVPADTIWTVNW